MQSYFNGKNQLCKGGVLASSNSATSLPALIAGYQLCARAEGKSPQTIAIVTNSVRHLDRFLSQVKSPADVTLRLLKNYIL